MQVVSTEVRDKPATLREGYPPQDFLRAGLRPERHRQQPSARTGTCLASPQSFKRQTKLHAIAFNMEGFEASSRSSG